MNRHIEALAEQFIGRGHDVRVLAPWDPPDRITRLLHRGDPSARPRPDYLAELGRTVALGANGAVSNLGLFPDNIVRLRRELRAGDFDVVHVHEPPGPIISWDACSFSGAPVVGTFHAYSTNPITNNFGNLMGARRKFNQLHTRIAVSEAAAWTGRRWYGGEYRIIPNGVELTDPLASAKGTSDELRILFIGRAEARKGLPVLLRAFEALVEHIPARLTVVGSDAEEIARYLPDPEVARSIEALGNVSSSELHRHQQEADVLCAPSLSGESFGMVLTEAFAAGTPVVASAIAGYSDVVTDGVDGILVPPADPQRLGEELHRLYLDPARRLAMGAAARESAERYAWPRVAASVLEVYDEASAAPAPARPRDLTTVARRLGVVPIDGSTPVPAARLAPLEAELTGQSGRNRIARRLGLGLATVAGVALAAIAAQKIGVDTVVESAVRSDVSWVLLALGLMMGSMLLRAVAWWAIARAAMPSLLIRRRDVTSATMIGVLMSATLPARLGEPARAMVMARRTGRMREAFPAFLGTLVSQTVLNIAALVILGAIIVATTDLFHQNTERVFIASLTPLVLLALVLLAPLLVRRSGDGRIARAAAQVRGALVQVRTGLRVFRDPRRGPVAVFFQLAAWGIQLLSCFALLEAMGLSEAGIGGAAAVLFAVNVTAVIPATPSNIGVFQLAVVSVLTTGFGVAAADALAYGVILQGVEIATAVALGVPALVREGMTWSDMRLRALGAAPVRLAPAAASGQVDGEPV